MRGKTTNEFAGFADLGIEAILRAVRFVRHNDNVAPIGEFGIILLILGWEELLDRGEDHPAGIHAQQFAQMLT